MAAVREQEIELLRALAERLSRSGRHEQARHAAEGIVVLCDDAAAHALLGAVCERGGDRRAALRAYAAAAARNPVDAASILHWGRMSLLAGDVLRGLDCIRRAWLLARNRNDDVARLARAILDFHGG